MKKLIPFIMLCLFSFLLNNEKASSKSNSQIICPKTKAVAKPKPVAKPKAVTKPKPVTNTVPQVEAEYIGIKSYDGFFFKI